MQLGLSTYSFPWAIGLPGTKPGEPMSALALLCYAINHKISSVQFGDNLPLHTLSDDERQQLLRFMASNALTVEVGTRGLTPGNTTLYLDLARQFGSPFLRMVIDDADYQPDETEVIGVIRKVLPNFQRAGVVLALENHDRFSAASMKRIIQSTDPRWVGICLDTANSLGAGEGIREIVSVLGPYAVNLHIKDITIERVSHKMGFAVAGCPAGQGLLNIPWLIKELEKYRRCATATLEVWSNPIGEPQANLEATLAQEEAWVEKSIHYLRTYLS